MISVERRKVSRTGTANLGYLYGSGYVRSEIVVTSLKWCILEDGKIIAECRGKAKAEKIKDALTKTED